tara:strand:- start:662 stop:1453 length:792 start_codon:yes stop_codon:yes gene_type:complete
MLRRRLIPVLYLKNGWMVRSENFTVHQYIGNPIIHVERMFQWDVDELIVLDIGKDLTNRFQHDRLDYQETGISDLFTFIARVAEECRIPLTFGGGLRSFNQINQVFINGADKVSLNSLLHKCPKIVNQCVKAFGSQAIVASVDYRIIDGKHVVFTPDGDTKTTFELLEWVKIVEDMQVGEIFLNSIDLDGCGQGYDIETIEMVSSIVSIPVIGCGGAGHRTHFLQCFKETSVSGVAAGNIFHFTENAYPLAKKYLREKLINVR